MQRFPRRSLAACGLSPGSWLKKAALKKTAGIPLSMPHCLRSGLALLSATLFVSAAVAIHAGLAAEKAAVSANAAVGAPIYPQTGPMPEFLERAFRYRPFLEVGDGGRFLRVPYDELKDINDRDEVPVRKVKSYWVRKLPAGAETEGSWEAAGKTNVYRAVGALSGNSALTVIYVHGKGGTRDWGFDDERFGGNFNRLKNLVLKAGGAYVSPDFTDFEAQGYAEIKALVAKFRALTKGPLVVSCGSLGNAHCWSLAADAAIAGKIDGLILLAGFPDERFFSTATAKSRFIPMIIGHGSWDPDYSYEPTLAFFRKLRAANPKYPVRYLLFETGRHGAPVRMIDWRDALNWIAAN